MTKRTSVFLTVLLASAEAFNGLNAADQNGAAILKRFAQELVSITPGKGSFPPSFEMGELNPRSQRGRSVTFDYSYRIAKYEVTQELWLTVMGKNPSRWKGNRNSVEMLSYQDAVEFCHKLTKKLQATKLISANEVVRLPTEAEWEYCARAGTKTKYSFGDSAEDLDAFAWHNGNAAGNDPPVGAKKPNPWGLYDMHGYLWEWCSDPSSEPDSSAADGTPNKKAKQILRSGSWKDAAPKLTSSFRIAIDPKTKDDAIGLRCVVVAAKKTKRTARSHE